MSPYNLELCTSEPRLDRIDLSTNPRDTVASLIKLLAPYVPYSLDVLGAILNTGPRTNTLQDIDPSKVFLWSTIPFHPDTISITDPPVLFSIVTFSHLNRQFCVFCSSDSSTSTDPPNEVERTHVKHVFEYLRDMAREARPTYDAFLTPRKSAIIQHGIDTRIPMIVIGAVHPKWEEVLAPLAVCQSPNVRYVFPPGAFARDGLRSVVHLEGVEEEVEVEESEIRTSDLAFVHGASTIARSDAYLLSRAPYSVCLRFRGDAVIEADGRHGVGQVVACALMHADGSVGALRVHPEYQRRGLGRMVLRALMKKLNFGKNRGDLWSIADGHQDLGGGALCWNWMDTGDRNEAGNGFLSSVAGAGSSLPCHWTYIHIN